MSDSHRRNRVISDANVYIVGSLDPMSNLVLIACASESSYQVNQLHYFSCSKRNSSPKKLLILGLNVSSFIYDTKHNVFKKYSIWLFSLYSKSSEAVWDSFGWWNSSLYWCKHLVSSSARMRAIDISQYAFLSVLMFLWTFKTSSVAA